MSAGGPSFTAPNPVLERRKEVANSQESLAAKAGCSVQAVRLAEDGRLRNPELVAKVASGLGWSVEELEEAMAPARRRNEEFRKKEREARERRWEEERKERSQYKSHRYGVSCERGEGGVIGALRQVADTLEAEWPKGTNLYDFRITAGHGELTMSFLTKPSEAEASLGSAAGG